MRIVRKFLKALFNPAPRGRGCDPLDNDERKRRYFAKRRESDYLFSREVSGTEVKERVRAHKPKRGGLRAHWGRTPTLLPCPCCGARRARRTLPRTRPSGPL